MATVADPASPAELDALFLRYARGGDVAALERVLTALADRSYTQARRIVGDAHLAEEAVQEAWLRLVATAARYDGSVPIAAWLARLVGAAAIDQRRAARRRRRRQEPVMPELSVHAVARDEDALAAVRDAVAELPPRYRQPIVLHYFAGLTQDEAARALGVPAGTIAAQLSRGRERLRARLGRAGVALSAVALVELITAQPSYAAPPALIAAAHATSAAGGAALTASAGLPLWASVVAGGALVAVAAAVVVATSAHAPAVALAPSIAPSAPSEVVLHPGDDLQAAVDAHPPRTRFRLSAGTYRLQQVAPKDGDAFVADGDAVLDGSRPLTGFVADGAGWRLDGVDTAGQVHGAVDAQHPMAMFPQELFVDGRRCERVATAAELRPGGWLLDPATGALRIADDPRGHEVAIASARHAFAGDARDVALDGLIVQRYATPAQMGAIGDQAGVRRWSIARCTVRDNHGTGIVIVDGSRVVDCTIAANGQKGLGGTGADLVVERCRIVGNNVAGFDPGWEAGGAKLGGCDRLVVRDCVISGNHGAGLLVEGRAHGVRIAGCTIDGNDQQGIALVSASGGEVSANRVTGNGARADGWGWGAQILLRDAGGFAIRGNAVRADAEGADGIVLMQQRDERGVDTVDDEVVGNDIVMANHGGCTGALTDCGFADLYRRNRFVANRYRLADPGETVFAWLDQPQGWAAFRAAGNDLDGTLARGTTLPGE